MQSLIQSVPVRIVLIILLVIVVPYTGYRLLNHYGERISSELFQEIVTKQSKNRYQASYEKINIALLSSELKFTDFLLTPTDNSADSLDQLFKIRIPELSFNLTSIFDIYWKKELKFQSIQITNPQVRFTKQKLKNQSSFSLETGNLYQLINQYISLFSIDSLDIVSGSFDYHTKNEPPVLLKFNNVNLSIKDFLLDSAESLKNDPLLFTDDVRLILTDQSFNLPDSIHRVNFEKLLLSTKDGVIQLDDFSLKKRVQAAYEPIHQKVDIEIPHLYMKGIDFNAAYNANQLSLDSIAIIEPSIQLETAERSKNSKYPGVLSLFESLSVKRMYLQSSTHDLVIAPKNLKLKGEDMDVWLENFYLDSMSFTAYQTLNLFEDVRILGYNQYVHLDSLYEFHFNQLIYDSKQSLVSIDFATGMPEKAGLPDFNIHRIEIEDVILEEILTERVKQIGSVRLYQPEISGILEFENSEKAPLSLPLMIDQFEMEEGNINLEANKIRLYIDDANLHLYQIDLTRSDTLNPFQYIDDFSMNFGIGSLNMDSVNAEFDHFQVTPNFDNVDVRNLKLVIPGEKSPLRFEKINLAGFNPEKYIDHGEVHFDSLSINRPDIDWWVHRKPSNKSQQEFNDFLHQLSFEKVKINKGQLSIHDQENRLSHLDNIDINLTKFHYDSLNGEYYTGINFHTDSFHIFLPQIAHEMIGSELSISQKDSTLDLLKINLFPSQPSESLNTYQGQLEEIKLSHLHLHDLINHQKLIFKNGIIRNPDLNISISGNKTDSISANSKKPIIEFERLNIVDGSLFLHKDDEVYLNAESFNVLTLDFDLQDENKLFYAKNFIFDFDEADLHLRSVADTIHLGETIGNSRSGNLTISDLSFENGRNIKSTIPTLSIKGFDTQTWLENKEISIKSVDLSNPRLAYGIADNQSGTIPSITIEKVGITDGDFRLWSPDLNEKDSLHLKSIDLAIDSLHLEPEMEHMKVYHSFTFSGSDLMYHLPDSIYSISLGDYAFSTVEKSLKLNDIKLIPHYNRGEYQKLLTYQKDWFYGTISQLNINDFLLDSLLLKDQLDIGHVQVVDFNLDTHRDKRLPREPNVFKPLPQYSIKSIPIPVTIDSINFENAYVSHSEFSPNGELPGLIFFRNINGKLANITNDSSAILANPYMDFQASGSLMNTGAFLLNVSFHLDHPDDVFHLEGSLGNMDLTELNRLLENTAFVSVSSGLAENANFYFEANNNFAIGKMKFYYDDLKISVLNEETSESTGLGASLKTFFANTFVVNSKNPHFLFVREGDIFHQRDTAKSIFNFWAKSLLSGAVSSIGAKNNKKEIRKQNEATKEELEKLIAAED